MDFKVTEAEDLRIDEKNIREFCADSDHFLELLTFFETNDLNDFDLKIKTIHRYITEDIQNLMPIVTNPEFFELIARPFQNVMSEFIYYEAISIIFEIVQSTKENSSFVESIPDEYVLLLLFQLKNELNHITLGELLTTLKTLCVSNGHFSKLLYENNIINLIWNCKPTDRDADKIYEQNILIIITELIECLGDELDEESLLISVNRMMQYVNTKTVVTLLATSIECLHAIMNNYPEQVVQILSENLEEVYNIMRLNDHRVTIAIMEFLWQVNSEFPDVLDPRTMIENMSVHLNIVDDSYVATVVATLKSMAYYMGNPEFYEMLIDFGIIAQVANLLRAKWPNQVRCEAALALGNLLTMCESELVLQIVEDYAVIPSFIELTESEQQEVQIAILASLSRIALLSLESGYINIIEAMRDIELRESLDEILEMETCVQSEYAEKLYEILFEED